MRRRAFVDLRSIVLTLCAFVFALVAWNVAANWYAQKMVDKVKQLSENPEYDVKWKPIEWKPIETPNFTLQQNFSASGYPAIQGGWNPSNDNGFNRPRRH